MEPQRWRRIEEIYHSVLLRPSESRLDFLREECAGDAELLREVAELLAHDESANSIVDRPVLERA